MKNFYKILILTLFLAGFIAVGLFFAPLNVFAAWGLNPPKCYVYVNFDVSPKQVETSQVAVTRTAKVKWIISSNNDTCPGIPVSIAFLAQWTGQPKVILKVFDKNLSSNPGVNTEVSMTSTLPQPMTFWVQVLYRPSDFVNTCWIAGATELDTTNCTVLTESSSVGVDVVNPVVNISASPAASSPAAGTSTTTKYSFNLENPIGVTNFQDLVNIIGKWIFNLAIPIAVIIIIYAGVLMLTSGGNPGRFQTGAKALWYAVLGLAVVLIGKGFVTLVQSILSLKK